jgi:hypothetical protein
MITPPKQFAKEMQEIEKQYGHDTEVAHSCADDLAMRVLKELGYGTGVKIFDNMKKWYG